MIQLSAMKTKTQPMLKAFELRTHILVPDSTHLDSLRQIDRFFGRVGDIHCRTTFRNHLKLELASKQTNQPFRKFRIVMAVA